MTNYDEEAIKFLATPENMKWALEIERLLLTVKEKLTSEFWDGLEKALRERVQRESVSGWEVERSSNKTIKLALLGQSNSCYYSPSFGCDGKGFYYGFQFSKEKQPSTPEVAALCERLPTELEFHVSQIKDRWLFWRYTNTKPETEQFFLDMLDRRQELIEENVGLLWDMFIEHHLRLEDINKILANQEQRA